MRIRSQSFFKRGEGRCSVAGENSISVQCACGKKLRAPATAVGKKARCPGCGEILELTAATPMTAAPASAEAPTRLSALKPQKARVAAPPPLPVHSDEDGEIPFAESTNPQVLGYQTPSTYMDKSGLCREKKLIVSGLNVPFPMRCVKCNSAIEAHETKKIDMYWQHPAYYAFLLLGLLPGAIILLCVRKKTEVTFGLCRTHRASRRNKVLLGWLIALLGLGLLVLSFLSMGSDDWRHSPLVPVAVVAGIALVFGSLIWAAVAISAISIRRIKDDRVWISGAGEQFLGSLSGS
jgi:hypothetical protein